MDLDLQHHLFLGSPLSTSKLETIMRKEGFTLESLTRADLVMVSGM